LQTLDPKVARELDVRLDLDNSSTHTAPGSTVRSPHPSSRPRLPVSYGLAFRNGIAPDEAHRTRTDDGARTEFTVAEILQILGAIAVLAAFVSVQAGLIAPTSYLSLALNLAGSALLAALALRGHQWGFVVLEASWAVVTAHGVRARIANRSAPAEGPSRRGMKP
jgi:hypothetical protein